jgi:2-isopropylmalate synthase
LKHKLKKSRQQVLDEAVAAVRLAREYCEDVEFSAEDATRTDWDYLEEVSRAVVAAGARTVNLPDTVGISVPQEYGALIGRMTRALGDAAVVSVHCHDDLGLAVANSLAAIQAGARQVECTINGIGERAGNAALEEVVMILNTRRDLMPFETRIVTEHLYPASQLLTSIITFGPQPNKAIVGENAFAHEAGIHQDGFLKERTTYEIMEPKSVGVPESRLVLGKHSGRHALAKRCADLGSPMTKEQLDVMYHRFTALADRKKGLRNDEIAALAREVVEETQKAGTAAD